MGDREGDDGEGGNGVGRPVASGGSGGSHDPPPKMAKSNAIAR